jgi:hypothetical protein
MQTFTYAECHIKAPYDKCHCAECHNAECHGAESNAALMRNSQKIIRCTQLYKLWE